jgi:hypothetical protein
MKGHEDVRLISTEMRLNLTACCVKAVPADTPFEVGQTYINDKGALDKRLRAIFVPPAPVTAKSGSKFEEQLAAQESFWRRLFPTEPLDFDPAKLLVWPRRPGHDRLIVMPRGLWANKLYAKCADRFTCCSYKEDLDKMIHLSGLPYQATARWFRDRQEADEELANKSALKLEELFIPGITLPERQLYELMYFEETGDHLDKENITLCSGSRNPDGNVPSTYWRYDLFYVDKCRPYDAAGRLRARGV